MPDTTPNINLPFPEDGDPTDVAGDFQRLAMKVDEELQKLDEKLQGIIDLLPPFKNRFVSNKELTWADLPAGDQPDNGSLKLLSQETRDNVPIVVETGEMVERPTGERDEHGNRVMELVPGTEVHYETRTVYTYEANFSWDNSDASDPFDRKDLDWLVDVSAFKDNQIAEGFFAFANVPAAQLTALPDLDTSNLTNMEYMFYHTAINQPLDNFDTSNVTDMEAMFRNADNFLQDLSGWCVVQIPTEPYGFSNGIMQHYPHLQPQWGNPC